MHGNPVAEVPTRAADDPDQWFYSVKDAARILGKITPRQVYRLIELGELDTVHIGRRRLVDRRSLLAYAQRLRQAAKTPAAAKS
jgi:excisionase family DNA binding protein